MDTTDPNVRQELERRLEMIETQEIGDAAHDPFPRADLMALGLIVVLSIIVGLIAGL